MEEKNKRTEKLKKKIKKKIYLNYRFYVFHMPQIKENFQNFKTKKIYLINFYY